MVWLTLKYSFAFTITFLILNTAARALGGGQPPNPALAGFIEGCEGQAQPCWYGIVPGVTTETEASAILTEQAYVLNGRKWHGDQSNLPCWVEIQLQKETVKKLVLGMDCSSLRIGDVVNLVGKPVGIGGWRMFFESGYVHASVGHRPELAPKNLCMDFRPNSQVTALDVQRPKIVQSEENPIQWRAALPYNQYVQRYGAWSCQLLMSAPF